ncbi:MAG: SAM-dependent methyltransferase [Actinobacteria bacterium]|nr:SAM-dependent methyltransferase [Actinomycetota bacterium]
MLARALDEWWDDLDQPDPYVVVEAGAGRGTLARSILTASPRCGLALRYVLVERAAVDPTPGLVFEPPELVLAAGARHHGPVVTALTEMPALRFTGVVLANELLDNLPFRLFERAADEWLEVYVAEGRELLVPAGPPLALDAPVGARLPLQELAGAWVRDAVGLLERGRLVVFDYTDTTASMARRSWTEWVRTYRSHGRGGHPLDHPGEQDVTCEVAVDQLPVPTSQRTQADFLRAHGVDVLVEEARAGWRARAHVGDLEALKERSRVGEGAALTDLAGLGGFTALEWLV